MNPFPGAILLTFKWHPWCPYRSPIGLLVILLVSLLSVREEKNDVDMPNSHQMSSNPEYNLQKNLLAVGLGMWAVSWLLSSENKECTYLLLTCIISFPTHQLILFVVDRRGWFRGLTPSCECSHHSLHCWEPRCLLKSICLLWFSNSKVNDLPASGYSIILITA